MKKKMRHHFKAFVLLFDEVLVVGLVVFVLWRLGVTIPLWAPIPVVAFLVAAYWLSYRFIAAQEKDGCSGQENMVGLEGKVVKPLSPEGMVKVRGELWQAVSQNGDVTVGTEVVVTGMEGLKLHVSPKDMETTHTDRETTGAYS